MTLFIDPRIAMSLMVFPIMITNLWQCYRSGEFLATARKYGLFASILVVFLIATTYFTAGVSAEWLMVFVGIIIILFAVTNLSFHPPAIPDRFDTLAQVIFAILAGIMGGLTAMWSPPIAIYLLSRDANKDTFVRTTGFLFLIGSVPLCIGFFQNGLLTGPLALVSASMIIPSLIGFSLGEVIRRKLNAQRFRAIVLIGFFINRSQPDSPGIHLWTVWLTNHHLVNGFRMRSDGLITAVGKNHAVANLCSEGIGAD